MMSFSYFKIFVDVVVDAPAHGGGELPGRGDMLAPDLPGHRSDGVRTYARS